MSKLYTMGHSNKSIEEFIALAKEYGITDIVDVRSRPYSKYNPQYCREPFQAKLSQSGIKYHFRGKNFGGLDGNIQFKETITKLLSAIKNKPENTYAVVCSEAKPEDCHRMQTIEPEAIKQGGEVEHIRWITQTERDRIEQKSTQPALIG